MKPIASSHRKRPRPPDDAAFTLTEMAASLVVAAMLVSGLGEITRQFARTTVRVRAALEETRDARLAQGELAALERADLGELSVTAEGVFADVGDGGMRVQLSASIGDTRRLSWERRSADAWNGERSIPLDGAARFELGPDGTLRLWNAPGHPPLLIVSPKRTAPFDCQYDVVVRDCR